MPGKPLLTRREILKFSCMGLLASPLATAVACQKQAPLSFVEPVGAPYEGTDEQLLDEIERASSSSQNVGFAGFANAVAVTWAF